MDFIFWIATDQALLPLLAGILSAAAIYPIGMLFGTGQGCCCNNPACCQHYCHKMCCNQIKWVVPGYSDYFTTVGTNCRAGLIVEALGLEIRVLVRCSGYVYGTYGETPYDCDTDCQIIEVEYSEDSGDTWTTTPPESAAGITWSIYCSGDAEQPTAEASAQRCAAITSLDAAQCEAADGEPCSLPCQDCTLPCGFAPTEWRLVGTGGLVWFAGDVIANPLYTAEGEFFCTDPCDPGFPGPPAQPRWLLEHFPFAGSGYNDCPYAPAGWPRTEGDWLYLEVLGCDGANWKRVHDWCECHPGLGEVYFSFSDATDPCLLSEEFWTPIDGLGNGTSGGNIYQSPPGCACLRDPANGEQITRTSVGLGGSSTCCPQCNQYLGATGCSTGLEYLGHGEAVRFTGAVDNEGSNLWNWEDANGDSPAGSWPTGDITIAGELRSWRGPTVSGSFANYHPDLASLSFPSVTLEPGAVLAISLTTETLTVDGGTVEATPAAACANGGQYEVEITVTGTATFQNGAVNNAAIIGNCEFTDSEHNGTITGDATFSGTASMAGDVTGTATFTGSGCYTSGTAGTFDPDPPPAC